MSIKCTRCSSDSYQKAGTFEKGQRFKCKDCGKYFFHVTISCPNCESNSYQKAGTFEKGQRYKCKDCGKYYFLTKQNVKKDENNQASESHDSNKTILELDRITESNFKNSSEFFDYLMSFKKEDSHEIMFYKSKSSEDFITCNFTIHDEDEVYFYLETRSIEYYPYLFNLDNDPIDSIDDDTYWELGTADLEEDNSKEQFLEFLNRIFNEKKKTLPINNVSLDIRHPNFNNVSEETTTSVAVDYKNIYNSIMDANDWDSLRYVQIDAVKSSLLFSIKNIYEEGINMTYLGLDDIDFVDKDVFSEIISKHFVDDIRELTLIDIISSMFVYNFE